jgi:hypothetical protein
MYILLKIGEGYLIVSAIASVLCIIIEMRSPITSRQTPFRFDRGKMAERERLTRRCFPAE